MIHVRRPHMERHRRDFVAEASKNEDYRNQQGEAIRISLHQGRIDFRIVHTASEAEDPTHAVNHGARGNTTVNEILERSFSRPSVMTLIPSEHVRGETDKL